MTPIAPFLALLLAAAQDPAEPPRQGPILIRSDAPTFELSLPIGYEPSVPREVPPRYLHPCGREPWAKVSLTLAPTDGPLPQKPGGVASDDLLPLIPPPPDSKWTFSTVKWRDLDIGVIEYRAVVKELPVVGLSTVLPLTGHALRIMVYAPDPLEKETREDFNLVLSGISRTSTPWFTPAELRKIATLEKVGMGGAVLVGLYLVAWIVAFRGHPMSLHWLRMAWLTAAALLFFIPITSPGPPSLFSNLLVNAIAPLVLIMLVLRRIKMGLDVD